MFPSGRAPSEHVTDVPVHLLYDSAYPDSITILFSAIATTGIPLKGLSRAITLKMKLKNEKDARKKWKGIEKMHHFYA